MINKKSTTWKHDRQQKKNTGVAIGVSRVFLFCWISHLYLCLKIRLILFPFLRRLFLCSEKMCEGVFNLLFAAVKFVPSVFQMKRNCSASLHTLIQMIAFKPTSYKRSMYFHSIFFLCQSNLHKIIGDKIIFGMWNSICCKERGKQNQSIRMTGSNTKFKYTLKLMKFVDFEEVCACECVWRCLHWNKHLILLQNFLFIYLFICCFKWWFWRFDFIVLFIMFSLWG